MADTALVTLVTRDSARLEFACPAGMDVLSAAETAGFYLPAMCHAGECGQCHAHAQSGAYEMAPHSKAALPDPGQGGILLCRCQPRGDLTIDLPYEDAKIARQPLITRSAIIESLTPAGEGALALTLTLTPDAQLGGAADFIPGQYMELTVPGTEIRRAYSLANLPNWDGRLDFLIRLVPGGAFSTWLGTRARVGEELSLRGPLGHFTLDDASPRPRVLVGGGCGAAPLVAMLRHLADYQDSLPTHLIFAANREAELLPPALFEELRAGLPQLEITLCVWHPSPGWDGFTGTAAEALAAHLAAQTEMPDIYLCGPPKMLDTARAAALAQGVPAERIFAERLAV